MKYAVSLGLIAAVALPLAAATPSFAAAAATKIQVMLDGEAGQPMSVKLDAATAQAGLIEFDVKNVAIGTDHEVVLVKLKNKDQKIVVDTKKHRIDEAKLKSMGEVSGLKPGDSGVLKVKLAAGDYLLLCNHKEHYELGMATRFTVTK
ncbi:MAG: copper resistance protein [Aestuariivirga sp.]